jgi:hypothetical protein
VHHLKLQTHGSRHFPPLKNVKNEFIGLLDCGVIVFKLRDYSTKEILVIMIDQPINQLSYVICILGLEVIAIANI